MVPSRSRKTAGRNDAASARSHLRGTQPATRRRLDSLWLNIGHATVIDRTAPQKTRTAVRLFLHNRAVWSDRRGAVGICRSKNCHNRQADCGRRRASLQNHCPQKLATRQQRRKISNRRLPTRLIAEPVIPAAITSATCCSAAVPKRITSESVWRR